MQKQNAQLLAAMIHYDRGDAMRIQHLVKVHGYAAAIGRLEDLDEETQFILEAAAILHDVGIHVSLEKYGSSAGKYQELEGPAEAEMLMRQVGGYTDAQIERVKYLVGHHHTYAAIDGPDYQILVEADFLVNLDENASECEAAQSVCDKYFKTETGRHMLADIFLQGGLK